MSHDNLKQYTWAEIQKHYTRSSLWIVFEDKVYDVTKFLTDHPGGEEVLLEQAAKDATIAFNDVGHSADALEKRRGFLIGEVAESERRPPPFTTGAAEGEKKVNWIVPIGIILLGVTVFFIIKHFQ
ncbi:Cytochrome b5-like isoform X1 [Oopsacas minuta]|uniref:Cytochrome b5 n=1 Tax=Oopsacas minuta TaxID=111878 RepID=A0AAV7JIW9_9METZ|nr:Cytochrome b5-like isoform X1 [Oopsacas minuta]